MLKLTEMCGMYCVLDPIYAKVVSCAIVERNHFREQFDKVPDNGKDKYKVQPSFHCWIVHYHSAHSATLRQLLQQVGNDIQTENEIVVGDNTSYIYMTQPTGTTSYTLNPLDIQQEYKSIKSYGFTNTEEQLQAWEVTNSKLRNDKKQSFTVSFLPCTITKFRCHFICTPSRHTLKKMFPGNITEVAAFPSTTVDKESCPVFLLDPYFGWKRSDWFEELEQSAKIMKDVRMLIQTSKKLDRVQIMTIRHVGAATVASTNHSCVWIAIGIDMSRTLIYAPDMEEPLALTAQSLSICMDDSTKIVVTMAVKLVHVYHTL